MQNTFINKLDSLIKISVSGKNIDRFINRLYKNKIEIYNINKVSRNKAIIKINYSDYEKVNKIKTIYGISEINTYGVIKVKKIINKNRFMIIFLLFSLFMIMFLSNIVFNINIVHSSSEIRNLINDELAKYGIQKYSFKKEYDELQKIKDKILKDNKDKLEWLEIENIGTTVRVKCEERIINSEEKVYPYQNIVATKDGIITNIISDSGFIKYEVNDYVKKGDILISGEIYNPSGKFLGLTSAVGEVYAEVWYKVHITYPLMYSSKEYTGNKSNSYDIIFFNKRFSFSKEKFKNSEIKDEVIIKNNLLPISIVKSEKKELKKTDSVNTYETALIEAENKARNTMEERLSGKEKILSQKTLSFFKKDSTIEADIFFSVAEKISKPVEIKEEEIQKEEKEE